MLSYFKVMVYVPKVTLYYKYSLLCLFYPKPLKGLFTESSPSGDKRGTLLKSNTCVQLFIVL